jgi:hypothetical protein
VGDAAARPTAVAPARWMVPLVGGDAEACTNGRVVYLDQAVSFAVELGQSVAWLMGDSALLIFD